MLDYSPNVIARSLTKQRTHIVGILTTDLQNPFYAVAARRDVPQAAGAEVRNVADRYRSDDSDDGIARLLGYQVDAVLVTAIMLSSKMAARCQQSGKPVVLVDRYIESDSITSVSGSNSRWRSIGCRSVCRPGLRAHRASCRAISTRPVRATANVASANRLARRRPTGLCHARNGDYTREGAAAATRRLLACSPRTRCPVLRQ